MANRAVAATNQWREPSSATASTAYAPAYLIEDPDFADAVTFADAGDIAAYLIEDPDFADAVTPDDAATEGDATPFVVAGTAMITRS